ncbi:MAG: 16S rRNA (cytidine(1402)-2'-O)-methyltransferase [Spirochaetes bacterium]|nr:16S rRNA (cytidine(1402)-2'-O)-methyltransferase [Spirochaetota bacterium]
MSPGTLYIIASPIGNLEDMTHRAVRVLREEVTRVYCEDTRQTKKLLDHYGIQIPLRSLHAHSPQHRVDELMSVLASGESAAYITDSGTPSVSDPGSVAVREARKRGIPVTPLPGPSALAAIVSVAGFPETTVLFAGFLSKKDSRRRRELAAFMHIPGIIVIYESPYRIKKTLVAVGEVYPGAEVVIGREMTKYFEEYLHGTIEEICAGIDGLKEKGEFTVAILNRGERSGEGE